MPQERHFSEIFNSLCVCVCFVCRNGPIWTQLQGQGPDPLYGTRFPHSQLRSIRSIRNVCFFSLSVFLSLHVCVYTLSEFINVASVGVTQQDRKGYFLSSYFMCSSKIVQFDRIWCLFDLTCYWARESKYKLYCYYCLYLFYENLTLSLTYKFTLSLLLTLRLQQNNLTMRSFSRTITRKKVLAL